MRKILFICLVLVLIASTLLTACASEKTSSTTSTSTQVTTPTSPGTTSAQPANWFDSLGTPTYGGTFTIQASNLDSIQLDAAAGMPGGATAYYERLFFGNWAKDRKEYAFDIYSIPPEYQQGWLAESWERPDPTTAIIRLRQGVHWSNKPPANGREFTAADVEFVLDRLLGTGHGFTGPSMLASMIAYVEKVTAIDTYTVQIKFKNPCAIAIYDIFAPQINIMNSEWIQEYGSNVTLPTGGGGGPPGAPPGGGDAGAPASTSTTKAADWSTYISTGPYTISDFVPANSITYSKVADYYGFDERHPQNRLPYIDTLKYIAIQDMTTATAALRTGKIDQIGSGSTQLTWQQVKTLQDSMDLKTFWHAGEGFSISFRTDKAPFTDIRVRQALQMAIDRESIASTYYGGTSEGIPCGLMSPAHKGWCLPYDQWPADLQEIYSYNPTKAKQMLADAGYPDGFNTNIVASTGDDLQLIQIIQAEFKDIGVNMDIKTLDEFAKMDYVGAGKHDQMTSGRYSGGVQHPWQSLVVATTGDRQNFTYNNDATFDTMYQKVVNALTQEEAKQFAAEADQFALKQCWLVFLFPKNGPVVSVPYAVGYLGEGETGLFALSRWWIDENVKKTMKR